MIGRVVGVMITYALFMVGGGLTAFLLAPSKGAATTALAIPSAVAVLMGACAFLASRMPSSRTLGMIGVHVGLVLPLLVSFGVGMRAFKAWGGVSEYTAQQSAYAETEPQPDSFEAYLEENELTDSVPDHDTTYLAAILSTLAAASVLAFVVMLLMRPKPADRDADRGADAAPAADASE